ncbi:MAG: hypothetical protein RQ826_04435 [Xanthomonadales bacterium]|nr:hypothetical protein [Xanthomonadales bacterium]
MLVYHNPLENASKVAVECAGLQAKDIIMHRRAFLLFVLFVVLAAFYGSLTRERVPVIAQEQQNQTRQLNNLDQQVLGRPEMDETGD